MKANVPIHHGGSDSAAGNAAGAADPTARVFVQVDHVTSLWEPAPCIALGIAGKALQFAYARLRGLPAKVRTQLARATQVQPARSVSEQLPPRATQARSTVDSERLGQQSTPKRRGGGRSGTAGLGRNAVDFAECFLET